MLASIFGWGTKKNILKMYQLNKYGITEQSTVQQKQKEISSPFAYWMCSHNVVDLLRKFPIEYSFNAMVWHFKIELNHNCSRYGIKQNAKKKLSVKTHKQEMKLVYLNNIPSIVLQSINGNIIRCKQPDIEKGEKRKRAKQ